MYPLSSTIFAVYFPFESKQALHKSPGLKINEINYIFFKRILQIDDPFFNFGDYGNNKLIQSRFKQPISPLSDETNYLLITTSNDDKLF